MYIFSITLIKKINKSFPIDIIDAHYVYPDGLAAVVIGNTINRPVVLTARGTDINLFPNLPLIRPMIRYSLKKAVRVISVCEALKKRMTQLSIQPGKIRVIPNGVDLSKFGVADRKDSKRLLGLDTTWRILLSVGELIPRKGFHVLIEAFSELLKTDKEEDYQLFIVGEGSFRQTLSQQIHNLSLESRVYLVGERPNNELRHWYNAADVFCLASSREGWANVIMEALACGTPVVATDVWGAPEILTTREVGFLVRQDSKEICDMLRLALKTDWDRHKIHQHVAGRTWNTVAKEVSAVLRESLESAMY
jgi:glycosyltransferase involved in cell wall biosynthesis